jgi:hypothetical protein
MIKERKAEEVWVEEAIKSPDKIEKEFGKFYARKKLNGLSLEVVYIKEKYIKVLTVYWI